MKNEKLNRLGSVIDSHVDSPNVKAVCNRVLNIISNHQMKTEELKKLDNALKSNPVQKQVNAACRDILCERLRDEEYLEKDLRILLEDIVNSMDFPLRYDVVENEKEENIPSKSFKKTELVYILLVAFGLYMTLSGGVLSIVGGLFAFAAGVLLGLSKNKITRITKEAEQVVATTAEELMEQIDGIYKCISKLFDYRQLEHKDKDILRWLQSQYSYSEDEEYKDSIKRLVKRVGYSLCEYSDERYSDFDSTTAEVSSPVTTVYAVVSSKGYVVCKGHVLFPM